MRIIPSIFPRRTAVRPRILQRSLQKQSSIRVNTQALQTSREMLNIVIESERVLTASYAPLNLNAYLTSNTQILDAIYKKTLPPSFPKALASLPTSPSKSLSSFLRSPKRRNKDTIDSVRSSVFDSPSTGSQSQSSDTTSRTTNSSVDDGMLIGKRSSFMFLGSEVKDRGPVTGVRSFVEGLRGREWHGIGSCRNDLDRRCRRGS